MSKPKDGNGKPNGKAKTGRKLIPIDADEVYKLGQIGCTAQEIAAFYDVAVSTITTRFQKEIKRGHETLKMSLRRWQVKKAQDGNIAMLIWLGKQYLGQSDKVMNVDDRGIEFTGVVIAAPQLDDDQRKEYNRYRKQITSGESMN